MGFTGFSTVERSDRVLRFIGSLMVLESWSLRVLDSGGRDLEPGYQS